MASARSPEPSGSAGLTDADVARVVAHWRAGGLVALPTETVYGLAADAEQQPAIAAIYALKGRPADHPLIVHVARAEDAEFWVAPDFDAVGAARFRRLVARFWPGPLTLIVPRRAAAPAFACAGQSSIGLRCPSHPVAQRLLAAFIGAGGHGIAAPSANRFGRISPTRAEHVRTEFGDAPILIVDGGNAQVGLESTIVDLTRGAPVVLRPGAITPSDIEAVLDEPVELSVNLADPDVIDVGAPRASGTLPSHYAPRTAMYLVDREQLARRVDAERRAGRRVEVLDCQGAAPAYARELYARLRELDERQSDVILVEAPPRGPAWRAVWDRLLRARTRD